MLPRLSDDFCRHQREMSGPLAPTQSGRLWPCVPPRAFELHGDEVGGARTIAAELRHSGSSDQAFPIGRAGAIARSASSSPGAQRPWLASSRAISTRMCATTCVLLPMPKPFQRSCREREKVAVRFALRLLKLDRLRHRGLSGGKRRGAADRYDAELEAARQAHLSMPTAGLRVCSASVEHWCHGV